jgi:starch-binding outer membrane protein, SusD/RagB family
MKTIKYITLSLVIILLGSCKDFLDTDPITEKTDGNYYSTPEEANEALIGCYDALQLIYSDGVAMPVASDVMSDLCFGGTGAGDGDAYPMIDEFDMNISPSDLNLYEPNWKNYYKGIFRCNTLIMKLDQVNWGSQSDKRFEIEAEARFLRAYFYFDMVRIWERVPLLTEPSNENIPQSEPDEIYKVIAGDLLFAADHAKAQQYGQIATSAYGHASKWAAEALLARVYLFYTGYYGKDDLVGLVAKDKALDLVEDVITNSGHDLVSNFSDLWPAASQYEAAQAGKPIYETTYAGENNMEIVFAIKYTYTSNYDGNTDGNHWMVMNGLRKMNWPESGYGYGWGACTVPAWVYDTWDPLDARKEASIMAIEEEGIDYTEVNDVKEYTGYFTKKYIPLCDTAGNSVAEELGGVNFMIGQYQDYFVIRFSDVLLMAAELGSGNALAHLNRVRSRAGLDPAAAADKDAIFEERRLEFAFEGLRYWDLLRYDQTLQYAVNKVNYSGTVLTGGVEYPKNIMGANLFITRGFSQIPYNQITLSGGVLQQNSGW